MNDTSRGLWRHSEFVLLWSAATVSNFGSMVRAVALPFVAILVLEATPTDLSVLTIAGLVPGFLLGLWAGVLSDRWPRRRLLIATDWGRAILLLSVPAAALLGFLRLELLYGVAFGMAGLSAVFGVAHRAYLPSLVERAKLVRANGALSAGSSAAEAAAFPAAGWLVQLLGAPATLLLDSVSFVASALMLSRIGTDEGSPAKQRSGQSWREIQEGWSTVLSSPLLRPLAFAGAVKAFSFSVLSVVYLLFVTRELGFQTGVLGMIFALGSVSSVLGAVSAVRCSNRLGIGPAIITGSVVGAVAVLLLPFAGPALGGLAVLSAHQILGDGPETISEVASVSLIQSLTPDALIGRVNGTLTFLSFGAQLLGAIVGGVLGETLGLRAAIFVAGACMLLASLALCATALPRQRSTVSGSGCLRR